MKTLSTGFLILMLWAFSASAQILTFTDRSAFLDAIETYGFQVMNFEMVPPGETFPPMADFLKGTLECTTSSGINFIVDNSFAAPSGQHYLGLQGDKAFLAGDTLTLNFPEPVHAVGLFIIGEANEIEPGDFTLETPGSFGGNNGAYPDQVLADSGEVFFLGILETDAALKFTSAELYSEGEPLIYEFHIDDIIVATKVLQNPDFADDCDIDGRDLYILTASPFSEGNLAEFALRFGSVSLCTEQ